MESQRIWYAQCQRLSGLRHHHKERVRIDVTGQDHVFPEHHCVAGKVSRFLGASFDQLRHMMADYLLGVLIEGRRMPHGAAISQGAKAGVEVIVTVLDQFDRDRQPSQHVAQYLMRTDIRAKAVTAK